MMFVTVAEMLWLFSCSRTRGRPGERGVCMEGRSGRGGSGDQAGIG